FWRGPGVMAGRSAVAWGRGVGSCRSCYAGLLVCDRDNATPQLDRASDAAGAGAGTWLRAAALFIHPLPQGRLMDLFNYVDGWLHAEEVSLSRIAAEVGTPVYVYSTATLTRHFRLFQQALNWTDHLVCFAVKANSNIAVLKLLGDLGAGMDIVSAGEYARARAAGVPGERIVFSGVGKTEAEMRMALEGGSRQFNVESEPELEVLSRVAVSMGVEVPIAVRVNPDVDARTHEKIATGKSENKFGIPIA